MGRDNVGDAVGQEPHVTGQYGMNSGGQEVRVGRLARSASYASGQV